MEIYILENLKKQKLKDMEFFILILEIKREIDMKDYIKDGIKMEKVFIIIKMVIDTKEILKKIKKMVKGFIIIKMVI